MSEQQAEAKHTPRPWSWYEKLAGGGAQGLVIDEKTGANIAVVYDPTHTGLIAAAPELLAALKAVTDDAEQAIKDIGGCDHAVGICCCDLICNVEHARAAIAKAERC